MNEPLRIVHLEDSEIDAELIRTKLEEEQVVFTLDWVETEDAFSTRLAQGGIDVILADYTLPSFDGLSALSLARARYPDLPFIFVSGTIGEDRAVETYRNGATDYVLKSHLSRLVPAIRRALHEVEEHAERRRAEEALRESEERYRSLFDNSIDAVLLTAPDGKIFAANPEACRIFGRSEEEIRALGRDSIIDMTDPRVAAALRERERTGAFRGELTLIRKDGSRFPGEISTVLYTDSRGRQKTSMIIRDVTERRRAEDELRRSEARFSTVFHNSPIGIVISRLDDGTFYAVNDSFSQTYGYSREELIGRTSLELNMWVEPEERTRMAAMLREHGRVRNWEARFRRKSGEIGDLLISAELIELNGDQRLLGMFTDITERKKMEENLRSSAQLWNSTFDAINDAVSIMDEQGTILRSNRAMINLVDDYPQDVVHHPCWEVVHHTGTRIDDCPFLRMRKSLRRESMVLQLRSRWFLVVADPMLDQNGKLTGGVHIMTDITEHRQFEEQLKESESKFRSLAEQSLVGIYIVQDSLFRYINPRLADMFGYSPEDIIDRMGPAELVVPEDRHLIEQAAAQHARDSSPFRYEARGMRKAGDVIHAEVFGSRAVYQGRPAIIGIVLDITEKKRLEGQLRQAQKMEAVGQLTSGIAHDFNNILSAIIGYASLLQMKMQPDSDQKFYTSQILAGTERAANLTRSLLTFSRKQIASLMPVDLNGIVKHIVPLIKRTIGEDIDLRIALFPGALIVNADAGQIEQVLMNFATNARDAMQDGGILTMESQIADAGPGGEDRNYVLLTVSDTGVGMDERTKEKIFEPFFTTKDLGRGTGLGLSMVYGIVRQHDGHILCDSELRMGTTFRVYLPLLTETVAVSPAAPLQQADDRLRGTETILVVEDDEALRTLMQTTLQDFGYTVLTAADGKEGLERFLQNREAIRLVLCDVIMPRMSGGEMRDAVRKAKPDARLLFMSGYPVDIIRRKNLISDDAEILLKPIGPATLLRRVREALDRA